MSEENRPRFPRAQTSSMALFDELPKEYADIIRSEIAEFNYFIKQIGINKSRNPNFLYAIETSIRFLLHRIVNIPFESVSDEGGFFGLPTKIYDSGYLLHCITIHTPFFLIMDDLEFPKDLWMLLDISKKYIVIQLKAYDAKSARPLITLLKQIKSAARTRNWNGNIKVYRTYQITSV